ncbi:hypothetical protein [Agromyces sp. M3QZ16-3]|uniref:hypothetical protein n=1 Tax=Agromyces sp. M3QZ16-3 TaxID=3447585 RepID=UPI003F68E59B
MNRRTATTVILTGSLVMLIGGGTASAAWGGPVREDRVPSVVGLARGHVIVRDDLSPAAAGVSVSAIFEGVGQVQGFSADARRELHSVVASSDIARFGADARRELHSVDVLKSQGAISAEARREFHSRQAANGSADLQGARLSEYAEAMRSSEVTSSDMQGRRLAEYADAMRELRSDPPTTESPEADGTGGDLSPLRSGR